MLIVEKKKIVNNIIVLIVIVAIIIIISKAQKQNTMDTARTTEYVSIIYGGFLTWL